MDASVVTGILDHTFEPLSHKSMIELQKHKLSNMFVELFTFSKGEEFKRNKTNPKWEETLFGNDWNNNTNYFFNIAIKASSVICSRCLPS